MATDPIMSSSSSSKPHILCVGVAAMDFVAAVDRYPLPNEKMRSTSLRVDGGGNAANTACAMGQLSSNISNDDEDSIVRVSLVTAIGADLNGSTIVAGLHECNVQTASTLYTIPDASSTSAFTYVLTTDVDGDSTRTCVHQPASSGCGGDNDEGKVVQSLWGIVQRLDLTPYTAVHFDGRYTQAAVALAQRCRHGRRGGAPDRDDEYENDDCDEIPYSIDVERPREGLLDLLSAATVLICNADYCDTVLRTQTSSYLPSTDHAACLRLVVAQQAPRAILAVQTLGSRGAYLIRLPNDDDDIRDMLPDGVLLSQNGLVPAVTVRDGALLCDAMVVPVVDTTGAGDAFQGGFLAALWMAVSALTRSNNPDDDNGTGAVTPVSLRSRLRRVNARVLGHALRIGTLVAAHTIQQPGARRGLPRVATNAMLHAEFQRLRDLVSAKPVVANT